VDDSTVRAVLAGAFSHGPGKTLPLAAPPPPRPLIAGGVPLCALADGPFGVAVVRALRLALAPQRFEPWNAYNDHRAYPSPRAAFVVDVAVRAGAGRWHLDPVREWLFGAGDPPPPTVAVTLELTADPGRIRTDGEHVSTGIYRHLAGVANTVILNNCSHLKVVGDYQPGKAQLAAQESCNEVITQ